jgi:glycosyltransferase involved in cell wall biosynthesis
MNRITPNKTLALFFTRGVSLQRWDAVGNLSREIKLYNHLAPHVKTIYFFTYGDERDLRYNNQLADNIVVIPKRWNVPSLLYMFLLPFAARTQIRQSDILKTNQMKGGLAALISKKLYKKPLVVRCGYEWLLASKMKGVSRARLMLIGLIETTLYRNADQIIVTAQNIRDFIRKRFNVDENKLAIISNYIDADLFAPMDVEKTETTLCFVGRLSEQKNLFNLISSIAGMDVRLVIFGTGELEQALRAHAKPLNVSTDFRGTILNELLPRELNRSTAFILPSLYEGNPKVLLEAMACGLPVIATNVVGNRELIAHKENGFLCGTDANSIRDAIERVMGNPTLMSIMGKAARKTIESTVALPIIIEKELAVYESL